MLKVLEMIQRSFVTHGHARHERRSEHGNDPPVQQSLSTPEPVDPFVVPRTNGLSIVIKGPERVWDFVP